MRFAFTDEHLLFRSSVRDVLAKECTASVVRAAWGPEPSRAPWRRLAELGVIGLTVSEEHGGLGMDEVALVLLLEETGRAALPGPIVETTAVAAPLLRELVTDPHAKAIAERWLPRIASGDATVSLTSGKRVPYALDADSADLLLLERDGSLFAAPRDAVKLTPQRSVDGARRLFRVEWDAARATRIAEGDAARGAIDRALDRGALGASAQLLGIAQQLIDKTVDYAKVRTQFGSAIGSFQAVKHHLAEALVKLEFARPVVYRAAYSVAHGDPARGVHVSMAKAFASDAALLAARAALQCHGAIGYSFEHDLHLWMKRAWALSAAWGDASWHRGRVGESVIGRGDERRSL